MSGGLFIAVKAVPISSGIRRASRREIEVELSGTLTKKGVNGQIISQSEAKAIETQAESVNQHVQQMFSKYRPTLGNREKSGVLAAVGSKRS